MTAGWGHSARCCRPPAYIAEGRGGGGGEGAGEDESPTLQPEGDSIGNVPLLIQLKQPNLQAYSESDHSSVRPKKPTSV